MKLDRVDVGTGCERPDAFDRQRTNRHPPRLFHLAEHDAERMIGPDLVVPIGRHEQRPRALEAPGEIQQEIERRLVGPVDVLDDDKRRLPAERLERAREDLALRAVRAQSEILQRRERLRREEAVTRGPEDADAFTVRGELTHERRLAGSGFAAHGDEPPIAGNGSRKVLV
jgi:hypothetical protein